MLPRLANLGWQLRVRRTPTLSHLKHHFTVKNQIRYDAYKTDEEGEDIVGGIELIMLRGPSAASTKKRNSGLLGSGLSGIAKITKTVWNVVRLPEHIVLYASASKQRYSCYPRSTLNSTQFRTSAVL